MKNAGFNFHKKIRNTSIKVKIYVLIVFLTFNIYNDAKIVTKINKKKKIPKAELLLPMAELDMFWWNKICKKINQIKKDFKTCDF